MSNRTNRRRRTSHYGQGFAPVPDSMAVTPHTLFLTWLKAWTSTGANGIVDVINVPASGSPGAKVVVFGYLLPETAIEIADMVSHALAELVEFGVVSSGLPGIPPAEPNLAPTSNTGHTTTDQPSADGDVGKIEETVAEVLRQMGIERFGL